MKEELIEIVVLDYCNGNVHRYKEYVQTDECGDVQNETVERLLRDKYGHKDSEISYMFACELDYFGF